MCSLLGLFVSRSEENGGDVTFDNYQDLEQAFAEKVNIFVWLFMMFMIPIMK